MGSGSHSKKNKPPGKGDDADEAMEDEEVEEFEDVKAKKRLVLEALSLTMGNYVSEPYEPGDTSSTDAVCERYYEVVNKLVEIHEVILSDLPLGTGQRIDIRNMFDRLSEQQRSRIALDATPKKLQKVKKIDTTNQAYDEGDDEGDSEGEGSSTRASDTYVGPRNHTDDDFLQVHLSDEAQIEREEQEARAAGFQFPSTRQMMMGRGNPPSFVPPKTDADMLADGRFERGIVLASRVGSVDIHDIFLALIDNIGPVLSKPGRLGGSKGTRGFVNPTEKNWSLVLRYYALVQSFLTHAGLKSLRKFLAAWRESPASFMRVPDRLGKLSEKQPNISKLVHYIHDLYQAEAEKTASGIFTCLRYFLIAEAMDTNFENLIQGKGSQEETDYLNEIIPRAKGQKKIARAYHALTLQLFPDILPNSEDFIKCKQRIEKDVRMGNCLQAIVNEFGFGIFALFSDPSNWKTTLAGVSAEKVQAVCQAIGNQTRDVHKIASILLEHVMKPVMEGGIIPMLNLEGKIIWDKVVGQGFSFEYLVSPVSSAVPATPYAAGIANRVAAVETSGEESRGTTGDDDDDDDDEEEKKVTKTTKKKVKKTKKTRTSAESDVSMEGI